MSLQNDTANHALNAAFNSVKDKTTFLLLNQYSELLWDCIPQGKTELSEELWDINVSEAIKEDYYDTQGDFSNGPDVLE